MVLFGDDCALHDLQGHLPPLYLRQLLQKLSPFLVLVLEIYWIGLEQLFVLGQGLVIVVNFSWPVLCLKCKLFQPRDYRVFQAQIFIERSHLLRILLLLHRCTISEGSDLSKIFGWNPLAERRLPTLVLNYDISDGLSSADAGLSHLSRGLLAVKASCVLTVSSFEASCFGSTSWPMACPPPVLIKRIAV